MWDVDVTWEQLEAQAPHRAYVVDCYSRSARLVRVLRSLSTVEKMLSVDIFPVVTPGGKIHGEEWFRAALDVCLARITAVRDCLFLLTATVFELDLADREVTMKNLRKQIGRSDVIALLERIAETGRHTRDERDKKFHRGVERDFDDMGLYHNISIIEMYGGANTTVESHPRGSGPTWDLKMVHGEAVATVRTELRSTAQLSSTSRLSCSVSCSRNTTRDGPRAATARRACATGNDRVTEESRTRRRSRREKGRARAHASALTRA
jgi:hypothetical protein